VCKLLVVQITGYIEVPLVSISHLSNSGSLKVHVT
jgi:hypothetical protein